MLPATVSPLCPATSWISWKRRDMVRRWTQLKYSRRSSSFDLSPQPGVFRSGVLKNRDVGVGVLPQAEEVLERLSGFRPVARERGAVRHPQIGERIELSPIGVDPGSAPIGALVIHDFLEFSRCLLALMQAQVSQAAQINHIEVRALVWRGGCQQFHALRG